MKRLLQSLAVLLCLTSAGQAKPIDRGEAPALSDFGSGIGRSSPKRGITYNGDLSPLDGAQTLINTTIIANGRGLITGPSLNAALNSFVPVFNAIGSFSTTTGLFTLSSTVLGGITAPYTSVNSGGDVMRIGAGNCPTSVEIGQINPTFNAYVGCVAIPAGTYTGGATSPQSVFSAYMINYNGAAGAPSGVGWYGGGAAGANGAFVEGGNFIVMNCPFFSSSCTGNSGFNPLEMENLEADTLAYCQTAFVSGSCPALLTGPILGFISELNATTSTSGPFNAFDCVGSSPATGGLYIPWRVCFATETGAGQVGASFASQSNLASSNAQTINQTSLSASGAPQLSTIGTDSAATWFVNQNSGETLSMTTAYPQFNFSQTIAGGSGMKLNNSSTAAGSSENLIVQSGAFAGTFSVPVTGGMTLATTGGNLGFSPASGYSVFVGNINIALATGTGCPSGLVSGTIYQTSSHQVMVCP